MTTNEISLVYETILSTPGMTENVKVDLRLARKNILLLCGMIERGLNGKNEGGGLLDNIPKEAAEELEKFLQECLQKAGLTDLYAKMKTITGK